MSSFLRSPADERVVHDSLSPLMEEASPSSGECSQAIEMQALTEEQDGGTGRGLLADLSHASPTHFLLFF